jgi:pilus assembly protein CpaE
LFDCVLVSSDESFRRLVLGLVRQPSAPGRVVLELQVSASSLDRQDIGRILKASPRAVFLDLDRDPAGVEKIRILSQEAPDIALIVAGPKLSADALLSIMRAGATEYLPRPFSREDAVEAFQRVRRRAKPAAAEATGPLGRVTTVFSSKGGTGVTTLATNLAVAIRAATKEETILLDLSPSLGTAAVAMGLQPRYTYLDVIQNFHRIDEELFRSFLEVHESGVNVLSSPLSPGVSALPGHDEILSLIHLCQRHFKHVIIDAGTSLFEHLPAILQESEERLLVLTPELPTLRNLKRALDLFGRANGKAAPKLILNQFREGLGLSRRDVEDGLGHRLTAVLDKDDHGISQSVNLGRPAVLVGKSKFTKGIQSLGSLLVGRGAGPSKERQGFLGKLLKQPSKSDTAGKGKR